MEKDLAQEAAVPSGGGLVLDKQYLNAKASLEKDDSDHEEAEE